MFKKLGQHFLINKSAINKIVSALNLQPDDTVIEIGPGKGALTFPLIKECEKIGCKLIAVEKDPQLGLRVEGLGDRKDFKIIIGDALKEIPKITKPYTPNPIPYKIVGNIPYYITGKLLRLIGELITNYQLPITNIILMVQKEVAERLAAEPPQMNLLAAAVQFWAEPKILFTLKPDDFTPQPEVNSAVIKLTTKVVIPTAEPGSRKENLDSRLRGNDADKTEKYYKLIRIIFKQPRKTIFNNLKTGLKISPELIENNLKSLEIDPQSRPQNLSIEQIKELVSILKLI